MAPPLPLTPVVVATIAAGLFLAGFVTGLTGIGFAVVGTAVLATAMPPATAIVLMLVPILAANVSLVGELDRAALRWATRRFAPYAGAALAGTLLGMAVVDQIPARPLSVTLGLLTLGYVAFAQRAVPVPGARGLRALARVEARSAEAALGFVSGVVFGATNVGVQMVAFLQSKRLGRDRFVGVVALVFLGISLSRVGAATALGLYDSRLAAASVAATVPGVAGVWAGALVRPHVTERRQRAGVFALLAVVGVRLLAG